MTESETPDTDAVVYEVTHKAYGANAVSAYFARELERQRNDNRLKLEQAAYEVAQIARGCKVSAHLRKRFYEIAYFCDEKSVSFDERVQYSLESIKDQHENT